MSTGTPGRLPQWVRDFALVSVKPAEGMRAILDRGNAAAGVVPLFLAATLSVMMKDLRLRDAGEVVTTVGAAKFALIVGAILCGAAVLVGILYLAAWLLLRIGHLMEGSGSAREVRLAFAWGLTPFVWPLLYRLPLAFTRSAAPLLHLEKSGSRLLFLPSTVASGCGASILGAIVSLLFLAWYLYVGSHTLAVAHRVPPLRGLAMLGVLAAVPVVIVVAAILNSLTS